MKIDKLKVDSVKLSDLISDFDKGHVRIPIFQRNYVWDRPRVLRLLNSIYKEYPIGTFFFWEADNKYKKLYRNIPELGLPESGKTDTFHFILDGQQRLTSLWASLTGKVLNIKDNALKEKTIDYSGISFDIDKEEFIIKKPDNTRYLTLTFILDNRFPDFYDNLTEGRKERFKKLYDAFKSYPSSIVYVKEQDLIEASEIFERINQGGVKLSLFDLVVASTWSEEFDLKEEFKKLNEKLRDSGFGAIYPEIVVQALALVAKGQASKKAQLQLTANEVREFWPAVSKAFEQSIDFVRSSVGVKVYEFMPYSAMLSLLAYFYASNGNKSPNRRQADLLREWFWKSAFSERYSRSVQSLLSEDKRKIIEPLVAGKKVTVDFPIIISSDDVLKTKYYQYSGLRNGIFCILADIKPLHFENASPVVLDKSYLSSVNAAEKHHIFPSAYLRRNNQTTHENSIVNFAFIPAELNKSILDKKPAKYFKKYFSDYKSMQKTLKSHLINQEVYNASLNNDFDTFLLKRTELILSEIQKRAGKLSKVEAQLLENPDAVIDDIEERFRRVIDDNLSQAHGSEYWRKAIPGSIQETVSKKINRDKKRFPDTDVISGFDSLLYADFNDYLDIILKHWNLFEDEFLSKGEFQRNFVYIASYRNSIKHNRKLSNIATKQGEAAVEWVYKLLEKVK